MKSGQLTDIKKLLVFVPSWVGDAVMATAALRAVRQKFPAAEITFTGSAVALAVLEDCDLCDKFVTDPGKSSASGAFRAARLFASENYDAAIMLANSMRVAIEAFMARIPRRIGYARDLRKWLLTDTLTPQKKSLGSFAVVPALDYYLQLADYIGCDTGDKSMVLKVGDSFASQADEMFASAAIADSDTVIIINPGASFGSSKLWPAERFAKVADLLVEKYQAKVIINAAPGESEIANAVAAAMTAKPTINFADYKNTLGLLKAIIAKSSLMITGDTGPRHMAAAMDCPVVTIFGSTDPGWTVIDCPHERIVVTEASCAPCQKKVCPLPPGDGHHICMRSIEVETVWQAASELLETRART